MTYHWGCGHSFEWERAEAHFREVLALCGDYCDLRLESDGVHDPHPCMDCHAQTPAMRRVAHEVNLKFGPVCDPALN